MTEEAPGDVRDSGGDGRGGVAGQRDPREGRPGEEEVWQGERSVVNVAETARMKNIRNTYS